MRRTRLFLWTSAFLVLLVLLSVTYCFWASPIVLTRSEGGSSFSSGGSVKELERDELLSHRTEVRRRKRSASKERSPRIKRSADQAVTQPSAFDAGAPEKEALDWELMSDDDRAKIGLTRFALHSSRAAANWGAISDLLRRFGHEEAATSALRLDIDLLKANAHPSEADSEELLARERRLLEHSERLPINGDDEFVWEFRRLLGQIEENVRIEETGEGDPVGDKIANEREDALMGRNVRGKNEADEEK